MNRISPDIIAQFFVLLVIVFMGGIMLIEITPFLSGILGTITLFAILKPYQEKFEDFGLKPAYSALLLMLVSIIVFLIPIALIVFLLSSKVGMLIENSDRIFKIVKERITELEQNLGFEILKGTGIESATNWVSQNLSGFADSTFTAMLAIAIMYFLLFYLLKRREKVKEVLLDYVPVSKKNLTIIWTELSILIKSHAIGIPLVAISQGIVSLIGFLLVGAPSPFFWFVMAAVTSLIPYGTALAIIPVSILMYSQGDNFSATFILIYGGVVVGSTDNLLRMTILKKLENVHPLVTLIGVIIGIPLFGFIGIIFGPVMISLFMLIVKLYKKEYG